MNCSVQYILYSKNDIIINKSPYRHLRTCRDPLSILNGIFIERCMKDMYDERHRITRLLQIHVILFFLFKCFCNFNKHLKRQTKFHWIHAMVKDRQLGLDAHPGYALIQAFIIILLGPFSYGICH